MNEQTVRFRLGIFVLACLILLGVLIILFGGTPTLFQPSDRYQIVLDNAAGVSQGTPVRRSGVKIGEVESLKLDDETGKVLVTIRVDRKYTLRQSDQPTVVQNLLGGDASIDFLPAEAAPGQEPDRTAVEPGATLTGKTPVEARDLVQKAGKVMEPTEEAMRGMKKFFDRMEKMTPLMEETLKEYRELAKTTRDLAPAVRDTNQEIQELAKAARATIPDLRRTNEEIQQVARATRATLADFKRTNEEIQVASRNWSKVGERLDVLLQTNEQKLVRSLDQMERALEQLNKVLSEENQRNLTLTLRNVSESSKQLDSITRNTDALLQESRKTVGRVNDSVGRADKVLANLEQTTRPMAERSQNIVKNLDEATAELNKALREFRALMGVAGRSEGTLAKLLTDPSLYNRLDEAACAIARTLPRVDRILRDVEIFADRIARHPELIGIGGAVRPSSGLKDLPLHPVGPRLP